MATAKPEMKMDCVLKQAVDRIRKVDAAANWQAVTDLYPNEYLTDGDDGVTAGIDSDCSLIKTAYMAEHPADDDELAGKAWLVKSGFEPDPTRSTYGFVLGCVLVTFTGTSFLHVELREDTFDVTRTPTRGDVRRLCKELRIDTFKG